MTSFDIKCSLIIKTYANLGNLNRALLYADDNTMDAVKNSIEYEIDTLLFSGKINGDTFGKLQKHLEDYLKNYPRDT